ncbi:sensor histidine kinase [Roseococcus suduntuyensis]|uniref:histidine kinase n=1 Tax=Roseococcus suduntuyensis TaxID=455361 RepID=A0A840AHT9_9PROT|nr:HAMP domain-containing sensor histidine kinase [Roseococcus suduntuyensis]MBB3900050.1 signal transduction histidine kinase [Roseococcus suduntuyensis]
MRALAPRRWPLALRVPLLITLLMVGVAGAISKLVLVRLEAVQATHFEELSDAYLDGLSTALLPAMIRRDAWEAFDALDRSRPRYQAVGALLVLVVLPDGSVLAASDPLRHPLGAAAPPEAEPAPLHLEPSAATAWIHRAVSEGGVAVGRIAAEVDVTSLATERRATLLALVGVNAALTLLFALLGWLLVRRMLHPVLRLSERLGQAAEGRLQPIAEADMPPADTEEGRAYRRYNAAAAAIAEREALLTRLAEEERRALVGRYASAMAHEVNNPLGGLFNAVRMIQRHGDDPQRRQRAASLLERGLTGIHNVVRASLILWRGEADARPVSAADIDDLRLLIESEARRRELVLDWRHEMDGGFPAPAQMVRQVALNLLLNACAASPPGGRVTLRAAVAAGALTLEVADEGPGLPAEACALLLDGQAAQVPQAGGLGLWTVARLVRELGARVKIAGPPGSRIIIRIHDAERGTPRLAA